MSGAFSAVFDRCQSRSGGLDQFVSQDGPSINCARGARVSMCDMLVALALLFCCVHGAGATTRVDVAVTLPPAREYCSNTAGDGWGSVVCSIVRGLAFRHGGSHV